MFGFYANLVSTSSMRCGIENHATHLLRPQISSNPSSTPPGPGSPLVQAAKNIIEVIEQGRTTMTGTLLLAIEALKSELQKIGNG